MKKILIVLMLCPLFMFSQSEFNTSSWEVQIGSDYFWGNSVHFVEGLISIGNGAILNGQIQKLLPYDRAAGLSYSYISTNLKFRPGTFYNGEYSEGTADMNIHFINTIATQYLYSNEVVQPYFDVGFGVAIYDLVDIDIQSRTQFLMVMGVGSKFSLTDKVGFKVNGGLKMPLYGGGTGLYCGIGGGNGPDCGLSFNSSVLVSHWELGGALTYSF